MAILDKFGTRHIGSIRYVKLIIGIKYIYWMKGGELQFLCYDGLFLSSTALPLGSRRWLNRNFCNGRRWELQSQNAVGISQKTWRGKFEKPRDGQSGNKICKLISEFPKQISINNKWPTFWKVVNVTELPIPMDKKVQIWVLNVDWDF